MMAAWAMDSIQSERLVLKKHLSTDPSDIGTMVRWLNDKEVVRFSEQRHKHHTEETQLEYLSDGPDVFRKIYLDDRFIGTISAYVDKNNSVADVGILIGEKEEWGKGYGIEAWTAFCDALFKAGIRKIEAGHMSINGAMLRTCMRYDMAFEGRRTGRLLYEGRPVSVFVWGKFA